MREQLEQYVNLLFAGAADCEDIKQEILQNTLDRYDDLVAQGKVPEAAYRLAIAGIGDVNEILGIKAQSAPMYSTPALMEHHSDNDTPTRKLLRAIAVGLYILSFIPLFILSEYGLSTVGLCCTIAIVAVATVMILLGAKKDTQEAEPKTENTPLTPRQELKKSIARLIRVIALILFFVLGFVTDAWFILWLIFPIGGAVKGLVNAILDLKEANSYEN